VRSSSSKGRRTQAVKTRIVGQCDLPILWGKANLYGSLVFKMINEVAKRTKMSLNSVASPKAAHRRAVDALSTRDCNADYFEDFSHQHKVAAASALTKVTFIFALLLILSGMSACQRAVSQKTPDTSPVPVEVAAAEVRTMPIEMQAIGAVEPLASVQLKSKVQGEILRVHFADGAEVREGDPLFEIDARPFDVALKRAQANLATARSAAANASEQAERYTTLIRRGVASKEQFSQYLSSAEGLKAVSAARQADVDEAQLSLDWTQVRAPISGRAGAALLKPGNIVNANSDVLTVINQMQPIYVTFSLQEGALGDVRHWMTKGKPVVSAFDPDNGRLLGTGELTFIDNTVDRVSGMIAFKATFPNREETLWPGQFVDVTLKLGEEPDALVVPTPAIMEGQQGPQVFVVADHTAHLRKVEVSRTVGDQSIVKHGLKPGELVITSGQLRVAPGAKVAITESAKPKVAENIRASEQ
jgi:multidrug efflux system membrane fusion protein